MSGDANMGAEAAPAEVDALQRIVRKDPRFRLDAYLFVFESLRHTVGQLGEESFTGEERHVTGQQLCWGLRDFAIESFGPLAYPVLRHWGVTETSHIGDIVYNLIEGGLMRKTERDRREHFDAVFDFEKALSETEISIDLVA